jgi:hypothetical protein
MLRKSMIATLMLLAFVASSTLAASAAVLRVHNTTDHHIVVAIDHQERGRVDRHGWRDFEVEGGRRHHVRAWNDRGRRWEDNPWVRHHSTHDWWVRW